MIRVFRSHVVSVWIVAVLTVLAVVLNHTALDIGRYSPDSEQQARSLDRGQLIRVGSLVIGADMDGSVVVPLGAANDVRTGMIDLILVGQAAALMLAIKTIQTKKS